MSRQRVRRVSHSLTFMEIAIINILKNTEGGLDYLLRPSAEESPTHRHRLSRSGDRFTGRYDDLTLVPVTDPEELARIEALVLHYELTTRYFWGQVVSEMIDRLTTADMPLGFIVEMLREQGNYVRFAEASTDMPMGTQRRIAQQARMRAHAVVIRTAGYTEIPGASQALKLLLYVIGVAAAPDNLRVDPLKGSDGAYLIVKGDETEFMMRLSWSAVVVWTISEVPKAFSDIMRHNGVKLMITRPTETNDSDIYERLALMQRRRIAG